jgi:hypothetical protein
VALGRGMGFETGMDRTNSQIGLGCSGLVNGKLGHGIGLGTSNWSGVLLLYGVASNKVGELDSVETIPVPMKGKIRSRRTSDDTSKATTAPSTFMPIAPQSCLSIVVLIRKDKRSGEGRGAIR